MEQLAKRDLLENRGSMAPLVQREILGLRDRRAKRGRRGELAILAGLARVAPWGLLGCPVLQENEATLDLQALRGAPDCLGCPAPWETR